MILPCVLLHCFRPKDCLPDGLHRLKDTFAVELLLSGVAVEGVSALLGHRSIRVKVRHYAPWNSARQDHLVAILQEVNARDEMLKELSLVARKTKGAQRGSDRKH